MTPNGLLALGSPGGANVDQFAAEKISTLPPPGAGPAAGAIGGPVRVLGNRGGRRLRTYRATWRAVRLDRPYRLAGFTSYTSVREPERTMMSGQLRSGSPGSRR